MLNLNSKKSRINKKTAGVPAVKLPVFLFKKTPENTSEIYPIKNNFSNYGKGYSYNQNNAHDFEINRLVCGQLNSQKVLGYAYDYSEDQ